MSKSAPLSHDAHTPLPSSSLSTEPLRPLLSISEAAELLGCSTATVRRMVARGEIAACRVGARLLRIDAASLFAMLAPIPSAK